MYSLKDIVKTWKFKLFGYPEVIIDNSEVEDLKRRVSNLERTLDEILPQALRTIPQDKPMTQLEKAAWEKFSGYKTLGQRIREIERVSYEKTHSK